MSRVAQRQLGQDFKLGPAALYYAQRLVTAPFFRLATARTIAAGINARRPRNGAVPSGDGKDVLSTLRAKGCAPVPPLLSAGKLAAVRKYLAEQNVVLGGKAYPGNPEALPHGTATADYPIRTLLECDELLEAANHPFALEVAGAYLGCTPTISTMAVRWSLPRGSDRDMTQSFHRDYDDWKFLKVFIYLNDVDEDTGPHIYVEGSHRKRGRLFAAPYSDEEVIRDYGRANQKSFVGPAGTSFFCDTYGIHCGALPKSKPRLMFLVQYSMLPVYAYKYDPIALSSRRDVDRYTNRLLIA
jgi:hypothetical protein